MGSSSSTPGNPREIWDGRYARLREQGTVQAEYEPWLERWLHLLPAGGKVLDLGCGAGYDSSWLRAAGYMVSGCDFSRLALQVAKGRLKGIAFLQQDLREGLPFATAVFDGVIANLSLHYFSWTQTDEILARARCCLKPGGVLLSRFNSTQDANYGAEGYPQVEPNAFWVKGMYKRYFNRESLETLFGVGWRRLSLEELSIVRFGSPKIAWEVAAVKEG